MGGRSIHPTLVRCLVAIAALGIGVPGALRWSVSVLSMSRASPSEYGLWLMGRWHPIDFGVIRVQWVEAAPIVLAMGFGVLVALRRAPWLSPRGSRGRL
ncbi:MAG: hypothetical protein FJ255_06430 [Phycisphaerae bacterium]|nr:hypothetical protein [Phycisphaerae bacterium]